MNISFKNIIRPFFVPQKKLIILTYHQVSNSFVANLYGKYIWLSKDVFEKQLGYIKNKFKVVPLMEGIQALQNNMLKETVFCLTFDDGDLSLKHTIVPLLEKYELPATFFINTAYIESKKGYWFNIYNYISNTDGIKNRIPQQVKHAIEKIRTEKEPGKYHEYKYVIENYATMVPEDINFYVGHDFLNSLNSKLFTLGLHGHEHQRFSMMSKTEQENNIVLNIKYLQKYKNYIPAFAIPFGRPIDWNLETIKIAKRHNLYVLLAYGGYNVSLKKCLLRDSINDEHVGEFINNLSPFVNKYYRLNNCL
jgi:peptidoglycan/xylan/chitin deacetylase (PgdA/CDA1 family)